MGIKRGLVFSAILCLLATPVFGAPFLVWDANPADQQVTKYTIYRDGIKIGETSATTYDLAGISPGIYTFTVRAVNVWGESADSNPAVSPALAGNVSGVDLQP